MNIEKVFSNLESLNLKVTDSTKFFQSIISYPGGSNAFFEKLNYLNKSTKDNINYEKFENKIIKYLRGIQILINKDNLFRLSDEEDIANFKKSYQNIINKYIYIHRLQDEKKYSRDNIAKLERLKQDIKDTTGTYELSRLHLEYQKTVKTIENSYRKIDRYIKKISESSYKEKYEGIIDDLVKDSSLLADNLKNLTLTNETKSNINLLLTKMAEDFTNEKKEIRKDIDIYFEMLKEAGIEQNVLLSEEKINNKTVENEPEEIKKHEEVKEEIIPEIRDNDFNEEVVEEVEMPQRETALKAGETIYYNGTLPYDHYSDISLLNRNKPYKISLATLDEKGNEMYFLEGIDTPFSVTLFETEFEKFNTDTTLKKGDKVYYNGKKDEDYDVQLTYGQEYVIDKGTLDEKGNEIYYLEGMDEPVSVISLVTENKWLEYIEPIVNQRVIAVEEPKVKPNKKGLYLASVANMCDKPSIGLSIKKAFSSIVSKIKEIKKDLTPEIDESKMTIKR